MLAYSGTYVNTGRGEVAPRHLQIYVNHNTIVDFTEAEAIAPQLNITLQEGEVGVVEYPLRAATFANVHSLSLYFVRARCASAALLSLTGGACDRAKRRAAIPYGYTTSVSAATTALSAETAAICWRYLLRMLLQQRS